VRSALFDSAMMASLRRLDTSDALSPVTHGITKADDRIPLVILVKSFTDLDTIVVGDFARYGVTLFSFRTPQRKVVRDVAQLPRPGSIGYPDALRASGATGEVRMTFVVKPDGRIDLSTPQAESATHVEFVKAVANALPTMRFRPLELEGKCMVRVLVAQPFSFSLKP
jgi:TonB family protein